MTARAALVGSALLLFCAVAAGAFGAHALRGSLSAQLLATYETAVHYHFVHALGLALVAMLWLIKPEAARLLRACALLLVSGIVLFSGSLYALALTGLRGFGAITPVGGVAWLLGWALLALAAWRHVR